mmetsp:Transcript_55037/g.131159  ORF Transcript_55037/g.131159 Transcript_55037/m.131159 type:complete len:241 (-) Transcript_55037:8-730(-)
MSTQGRYGEAKLPFVAVGRLTDNGVVACYSPCSSHQEFQDLFEKVLKAAPEKLSPGGKIKLQWSTGGVCCYMDPEGKLLYCLVTALLTYPERLAFQLLSDLRASIVQGEASQTLTVASGSCPELVPRMKELISHYEDPANFAPDASGRSNSSMRSIDVEHPAQDRQNRPQMSPKIALLLVLVACLLIALLLIRLLRPSGASVAPVNDDGGDGISIHSSMDASQPLANAGLVKHFLHKLSI